MLDDPKSQLRQKMPIILYGAGSQALVVGEMAAALGFDVVALLNDWPVSRDDLCYPIYTDLEQLLGNLDTAVERLNFTVSIGSAFGRERQERYERLASRGLNPATLVDPRAFVSPSAVVGPACQIMPLALLHTRAVIGSACVLNSRAVVEHECRLGRGVHIAPGAVVCGRVNIGDFSFIGAGATVAPDIEIGDDVIVGAGAAVVGNLPAGGIYAGVPARLLRKRNA